MSYHEFQPTHFQVIRDAVIMALMFAGLAFVFILGPVAVGVL